LKKQYKRKTEIDASYKSAFEMRIGINAGCVVAGFVGVKKFQYDIWENRVESASRIESKREAGGIHCGN
jgi:class 3 adenylate cyclase